MLNERSPQGQKGAAYWYCTGIGTLMALIGIVLGAGGIWLIALGGSWYYLIAGVGLVVSGMLLAAQTMAGLWVYLLTYIFTLVWAFWEVGTDWWAQVPRLVAPSVILVLVLICIPMLRHRSKTRAQARDRTAASTALPVLASLAILAGTSGHFAAHAQEAADPASPGIAQTQQESDPAASPAPGLEPDAGADVTAQSEDGARQPAARAPLPVRAVGEDWPSYGGSIHATRNSPLSQINTGNVDQLERVWTFNSGDLPDGEAEGKYSPENTPLKIGRTLYHCTAMGIMVAIDAGTGKEEWRHDPEVPDDAIPYGATCRGAAYFEVPDADPDDLCATRVLWATLDARLIAVDAQIGESCPDFGLSGQINLEEGIGDTVPGWYSVTSPPIIVRGVAVVGAQVKDGQGEDAPSGVVRGFDAVTGELAWAWDLGNPGNRGAPAEGETYTRGTPNMWTTPAADEELGYVYLPLGNSSVDYYGSNRSDLENEYATSIVAVDVTTGEDVWHFQTVYRDVWDYDLGSQPALVDFPGGNGTVPAIIVSSKQGDIYVLNRETGESLFPVEVRAVPTNMGVEPDYLSDVQPFSTYHTLAFEPLTEKDMWGMSPLDQLWCRIQFRRANYAGMYTPPTTEGRWIQYPGYNGGQDWGSMAVDEERGILIANYNDMPNFNRLIPREEVDATAINSPEGESGEAGPQIGAPYGIAVNAGWRMDYSGLLCKKPPYGGIRAIDLATGETLWDQPLGQALNNGPFGIPSRLPFKIGTPNNGGPIVTAGGLVFIAAATDGLIRAIDIETGEVLWTDSLPAGGQTTPITFEVDGRQFIVLAPGGHHFMETPVGDAVIAWALPE
ncbi:membrane-bound PQQ-dependent dehydrogenase, glucose/quinate/shikimate family [Hoeflea sp. YIM 152468]|uniref:membrane-bound PQQ-dependent dehydrogenase, glucose/quinate/shikimate family n=1 Tax=Hoeflea sp. YIM 152468 TaxID=3031759 RepID=UPI0023DA7A8D|nr:membrane-bound PQQ-dependent dehydrogenase, glucose/quinate/shikimate family [Hoeflea sp. YIM 152468]MDF1609402.1 membrane-bound PQQ-dependent dehydrogenase, glucose/quinate/shikimate family [Hoeflea sp. YIM 152468]